MLVAFIVLGNPLCLLGLWLDLKLFSLFTNFLSTMRIWCFMFFSVARRNATPHTHHTTMKLQLQKRSRGYYSATDGKLTITVSDSSVICGGESEWQIVIEDNDEIVLSEFCATKRDCYSIGVRFLTA